MPELPSYGNFKQGHSKPAFFEKMQRGDQRNFSKIAQKVALFLKAQKDSGANGIILNKILAHKRAPKVPEWQGYGNFRQVTQTRIFWKSAKGGQGKFFKNRPKGSPRLNNP